MGKKFFSTLAWPGKEAGNLSALSEFPPASSRGAREEGRMQEAHPDLQAGLRLQNRGRGFLGSIAHSPIVRRAEDNLFPTLSLRFVIWEILIPKVQEAGHCMHGMRPPVKPHGLTIAFTLFGLGRQEASSQ